MKRLAVALALALTIASVAPTLAGSKTTSAIVQAATTITVTGKEFSFGLSKKSAKAGKIVFKFTNKGKIPHDFKIARKKTPLIGPGKSATLTVNLKKGSYRYICTVPGHAAAGMKGTFKVT
jgi:uncharacterized cupredoxin-like copper-binding protein